MYSLIDQQQRNCQFPILSRVLDNHTYSTENKWCDILSYQNVIILKHAAKIFSFSQPILSFYKGNVNCHILQIFFYLSNSTRGKVWYLSDIYICNFEAIKAARHQGHWRELWIQGNIKVTNWSAPLLYSGSRLYFFIVLWLYVYHFITHIWVKSFAYHNPCTGVYNFEFKPLRKSHIRRTHVALRHIIKSPWRRSWELHSCIWASGITQ